MGLITEGDFQDDKFISFRLDLFELCDFIKITSRYGTCVTGEKGPTSTPKERKKL